MLIENMISSGSCELGEDGKSFLNTFENALFIRLVTEKELSFYGVEKTGYAVFDINGDINESFGTGTLGKAIEWIIHSGGSPRWMH